jgi:hypothetical protein
MNELKESMKLKVWEGLVILALGAGAALTWGVRVPLTFPLLLAGLVFGLLISRRRERD